MQGVNTVGIFSRPGLPQGSELIPGLVSWLAGHGIASRYDLETAAYLGQKDGLARHEVPEGCQFVIVLGGDGTLLAAAKAIAGRDIPLLGVNLGSLGFLTAITVDELYPELERAIAGQHRIGHRTMIDCTLVRAGEETGAFLALNDIVISKRPAAHMIDLDAYAGAHHVCSYKADGLIIATPTGSTAYSLSAGGPVVFPQVAAFAITPICPHTLTHRPVIVPDSTVIKVVNQAPDDNAYLNVDGQLGLILKENDTIYCRLSEKFLRLIRPPRLLYFDVLREKLKWGER
jgi:NAD+ kinase